MAIVVSMKKCVISGVDWLTLQKNFNYLFNDRWQGVKSYRSGQSEDVHFFNLFSKFRVLRVNKMDIADVEFNLEAIERPGTPFELIEAADEAVKETLPNKSRPRYNQVYNNFQKWKKSKQATSNSERVLLAYFGEMASQYSSSTLWARFSMLKAVMKINDNIDISTYSKLNALLKKKSEGYEPKKAITFTDSEMQHFIDNAPDELWLDVKVACIFGFCDACRTHELPTSGMNDIARYDDMYYVTVDKENTKTKVKNSFAIIPPLLDYVRRYESLRPAHATTDRFFLNYQHGKCTVQTIGKNKFCKMRQRMATFLNLPDPDQYTGHSVRRTSITSYANSGASIEAIKRHSNHKSTKICESYISESVGYTKKVGQIMASSLNCTSTSTAANSNNSFGGANNSLHSVVSSAAADRTMGSFDGANNSMHSVVPSAAADRTMGSVDDSVAHPLVKAVIGNDNAKTSSSNDSFANGNDSIDLAVPPKTNVYVINSVPHPLVEANIDNDNRKKSQVNVVVASTDINSSVENIPSRVSTQNCYAQLDKRFVFNQCDHLTISFK